jgi:hypothetical protein
VAGAEPAAAFSRLIDVSCSAARLRFQLHLDCIQGTSTQNPSFQLFADLCSTQRFLH